MKKITKIVTSILLLFIMVGTTFAFGGHGKGYGKNQGGQLITTYDDTQVNHGMEIDSYPIEELSEEEISGLLLMREEEKLARDVYLTLYDIWGQNIFSNIARSEETHTNAIKLLLDKYSITDPMTIDDRGVFENQELQDLYKSLVSTGSESLVAALTVGATVEDLDIKDLNELLDQTDNLDITAVYNNLNKGSRNHLRSFMRQLDRNGGVYIPQFISVEEFDLILSADMEAGIQYNSDGIRTEVEQKNMNSNQGNGMNEQENSIAETKGQGNMNDEKGNQNIFQRFFAFFGFN